MWTAEFLVLRGSSHLEPWAGQGCLHSTLCMRIWATNHTTPFPLSFMVHAQVESLLRVWQGNVQVGSGVPGLGLW